jgi:hypothetical protein
VNFVGLIPRYGIASHRDPKIPAHLTDVGPAMQRQFLRHCEPTESRRSMAWRHDRSGRPDPAAIFLFQEDAPR